VLHFINFSKTRRIILSKVRFTSEQVIRKLREAEVLHSQGAKISEICKQLEIHEQTYYKWRKEYGSIRVDQAKRLKDWNKRMHG